MVSMRRKRGEESEGALGQESVYADGRSEAYDRFGGVNVGAAFFGWMVAVGTTVLLTGLIGLVLAVLDQTVPVDDVSSQADIDTAGLIAALVLLGVLLLAYYSGGYVAGRMSRFDGSRQGLVVWLFALLFSVLTAVGGYVAGDRYDVVDRAGLPTVSFSSDLTLVGLISLAVVLLGTLLAAMVGGKVGQRYHSKVDRAL